MRSKLGRILCVIPAKAGSKRAPRKNIRPLAGITLLERTIHSAQKAGVFDRIYVSTEDTEVAGLALRTGVDIPFMRPEVLSKDPYGVVDVCLHVLDEFERRQESYDTLVILLPTSPFRHVKDIAAALDCFVRLKVNFLMSVVKETHSPLSSLVLQNENLLPLHPEWLNKTGAKATALPEIVRCNGAITIVNVQRFREEKNYYAYPLGAYEMPVERSLDIDTELEFSFAEFLARNQPELLDE